MRCSGKARASQQATLECSATTQRNTEEAEEQTETRRTQEEREGDVEWVGPTSRQLSSTGWVTRRSVQFSSASASSAAAAAVSSRRRRRSASQKGHRSAYLVETRAERRRLRLPHDAGGRTVPRDAARASDGCRVESHRALNWADERSHTLYEKLFAYTTHIHVETDPSSSGRTHRGPNGRLRSAADAWRSQWGRSRPPARRVRAVRDSGPSWLQSTWASRRADRRDTAPPTRHMQSTHMRRTLVGALLHLPTLRCGRQQLEDPRGERLIAERHRSRVRRERCRFRAWSSASGWRRILRMPLWAALSFVMPFESSFS